MMQFKPKDKLVLVTGASSGLGTEIAKAFALKGAKVALTARSEAALKVQRDIIRSKGGLTEMFPFDLSALKEVPRLIEEVKRCFGGAVDILVNCAGIAVIGLVEDVPLEEYEYNLKLNFFAPLALIKAVLPDMKTKRSGQIINISSGVGKRGLPGVSSYCVSKFSLNALSESLRIEAAPYGIQVVLFSPGLIDTRFAEKIRRFGKYEDRFNQGNPSSPEKVARRIVSASERREKEVTLSLRTNIIRHLNYWVPDIFDQMLLALFKRNLAKEKNDH